MDKFLENLWCYPISDYHSDHDAHFLEQTKKRNFYYDRLVSSLDSKQLSLFNNLMDAISEIEKHESKVSFIRGAKTVGGIFRDLYGESKPNAENQPKKDIF